MNNKIYYRYTSITAYLKLYILIGEKVVAKTVNYIKRLYRFLVFLPHVGKISAS